MASSILIISQEISFNTNFTFIHTITGAWDPRGKYNSGAHAVLEKWCIHDGSDNETTVTNKVAEDYSWSNKNWSKYFEQLWTGTFIECSTPC